MSYFGIQDFDITEIINRYQGKKIEEIFQNYQIVKNEYGEFVELIWKEQNYPCSLNLSLAKKKLFYNLKTVHDIGEFVEDRLKRRGVKTLKDLKVLNLRFGFSANRILDLIRNKDFRTLKKNRYIDDLDVSFCFRVEDLLFLDIETLGVYNNAVIILGIGFFKKQNYEVHLFFARNLEEEIAICEHFKNEILPEFKCFVSYNGKSFDIPVLSSRLLYYFDKNPMISEQDIPYTISNTKFHHIDLYHICRRRIRGMVNRFTLINIEEQLLNLKRENELPGSMVPLCYKKYLKDPERYIGLIKECIEHNYYDVYSMPLILKRLLEI